MKIFLFPLVFLFLSPHFLFSAEKELIIKLKKEAPPSVVNNFRNNSPSTGSSDLARKIRDLDIRSSRTLFKDFQSYFNSLDNFDDEFGLSRIFVLEVNESKAAQALDILSGGEYVEYIQFNNLLKLENNSITPNDPYFDQQYYLATTGMVNAWDITLGDSNIIIGVIDSGLDFTHPDLLNSFKINYGESGNGRESNGIDDDGNGFIDDWRGWNFINWNNDPSDDNRFSHGTAVSGVINAGFNNAIGIASVAPQCKILVMKVFDSEGFGKESDASSAVLYGLMMGVKVFNFSFGDYIFSNLLRDIVKFAHFKNALIVASAGNDGTDRLHYPSAYDEVISVGASDPSDQKAGFSSFGETVDIFAPGFQTLTTTRVGRGNSAFQNNYDKFNGTSFAAPQITGIAALLFSLNPNLSNEEVRGIIVSTTSYMAGQNSWNHNNSSGRLNSFAALQNFNNPSIARIHFPFQDFTFEEDNVPICISAASPFLRTFSVMYGTGENPGTWNTIIPERDHQVLNDTAGYWNTSALPDTSFTLRLSINSNSGRTIEHRMIIFKDKDPPQITDVNFGNMIDKNFYSQVILFRTDKRTLGKVFYRKKNSSVPYQFILADIGDPNTGFVMQDHLAIISGNTLTPDTDYEFYIEAVSLNGKKVTMNKPDFIFRAGSEINSYGFIQKPYSLPFSQSARKIIDVTGNGRNDIFINEIKSNLKLNVYEFSGNAFSKISNDNWEEFKVARDLADLNGNGKLNLLISKSRDGYLYEAPAPGSLPVNLIWSDSGNNNFWSARFADTDSDGRMEFLGFTSSGLKIMEAVEEYNFAETAVLPYFGLNPQANSQNVLVEDFNNDGRNEICFINLYYRNANTTFPDLALNVYRNTSDNNYSRIFTDTLRRFLKFDNIDAGDFTGDGQKEIAIGTVSRDGEPVQYYSLYIYKPSGNSFALIDIVEIYNYKANFETSTRAGNIDDDERDEILINVGTHYYILKFDDSQGRFVPILYKSGINSTNQIIFDFDGNGVNEIGLNTINDTLLFYEKNISFAGPSTPLNLEGYSLDSNLVRITFSPVAGADTYRIYKADSTGGFILYDSASASEYFDENILNRTTYRYRISAVDYSKKISESILSDEIPVYVHNKSRLISANYDGQGNISVKFSERISTAIPNMNHFIIEDHGHPDNIAIKNDYEYFLHYTNIPNGEYNIYSSGLRDFYNSPVDSNMLSFNIEVHDSISFYLVKLNLVERLKLKVEFNLNVDSVSVLNNSNYILEPFDIRIINVEIDPTDKKIIYLTLEDKASIGATGKNYVLKIRDIYSESGIKIVDGAGSSFGMIFNKENLDEVYTYPNPYSTSSGQKFVTFANLTQQATIRIYDLTGKFIREIVEQDGNGGVEWDLKDENGRDISTGIYFYNAEGVNSAGEKVPEKFGKFAIVK